MQMKPTSIKGREEELSLPSLERRRFLEWLAAAMLIASQRPLIASSGRAAPGAGSENTLRMAAIQMTPQLGAVDANLAQAGQLVRQAAAKDTALIMLPEMFTSAAAFQSR